MSKKQVINGGLAQKQVHVEKTVIEDLGKIVGAARVRRIPTFNHVETGK